MELKIDKQFIDEAVQKAVEELKQNNIWIPNGMTNGEVIKTLFPKAEIEYWAEYSTYNIEFPNDNDVKHFSYNWWNAPYQKGGE